MDDTAIILDTNIFVAAGFNRASTSARIVERVRSGDLRMMWNEQTRRESQFIVNKIPPLSWEQISALFREEDRHEGKTAPEKFGYIPDEDDRKFAALAAATGAILITNDDHLLAQREQSGLEILTPGEYWAKYQQ
jgi:predicted nucleic acid-binding protein